MSCIRISNNIYSIGVQNPGLRNFDIIMEAKYGTTYNSFLITDKKTVLIDNVHLDFFDDYLYNVQSLIDLMSIDYVVMNHTEPDHSGGLIKLLNINPNITVVCSGAAKKNLSEILNSDFKSIVVKNGDLIDIGSTSLEFIVAPLLHWPDSMMTYHKKDKVLFSCDFLGCHFCEPNLIDTSLHYPKEYLEQFKYYFDCIFSPFKPYVLSGLEKIKNLKTDTICPSHGPILTDSINDRINNYINWSKEDKKFKNNILILYASSYGYTKKLALAALNNIKDNAHTNLECMDVVLSDFNEIVKKANQADCLIIGSCTINRDAPKIIWDILSSLDAINTRSKKAMAFGSFGWTGEAPSIINNRLTDLNYQTKEDVFKVKFNPTDKDINNFISYVNEFIL